MDSEVAHPLGLAESSPCRRRGAQQEEDPSGASKSARAGAVLATDLGASPPAAYYHGV